MKLLLDQGLPRTAAELLRVVGFDTLHVGDVGLALGEQRIVVTLDADFHALLALSAAPGPSVIRIRIEGLRAETIAALIQAVMAQCEQELAQGAVVTVQESRLRVRRLPLV
jgi:predicted nuclease of predicted toxin-antitoxin system